MDLFIKSQPRSRKTLPKAGFLEVLFLGLPPSAGSSGQCVDVVVGVYGFSLITSVDSRVVCSLSFCTIDPGSAPSTVDLIFKCSGHRSQPTILCQSRSVYSSMSNPLLVEPAGTAPASCTLFGSLHTTISYCANIYAAITRLTAVITAAILPMSRSCSTV